LFGSIIRTRRIQLQAGDAAIWTKNSQFETHLASF